jgi:solute carrier family 25 carnitine/acylcarnitine transporter 20/29
MNVKNKKRTSNNMRHFYEEFSCSIFTGLMKVSIIQPFDFIRFRIQSHSFDNHQNTSKIIKKFLQGGEGLRAFLKGINVTTFSVFSSSIIQFTFYQEILNKLSETMINSKYKVDKNIEINSLIQENKNANVGELINKLSLTCALSGFMSGLALGLLLTPVDNVRIKLQAVQNVENASKQLYRYRNSWELIAEVYKANGIRGLYIALPISLAREGFASFIYFGSFEYLKSSEKVKYNRKQIKLLNSFFYGAFAGGVNWLITLPIDIIKTKMISDTVIPDKREFKNYRDCAKKIFNQLGIKGFYTGFSVVFTRALIVNGVVLTSFDICRSKYIKH